MPVIPIIAPHRFSKLEHLAEFEEETMSNPTLNYQSQSAPSWSGAHVVERPPAAFPAQLPNFKTRTAGKKRRGAASAVVFGLALGVAAALLIIGLGLTSP